MQLESSLIDVKEETMTISPDEVSPLHCSEASSSECSSSSSLVNFNKLSDEKTIGMSHIDRTRLNSIDSTAHEEDDENFDNEAEAEAFDNDDDDDGDAQGERLSRGKWTIEEDETLREAVQSHAGKNWKKISDCLEGRTDVQCLHRWQKVLRPGLIKGPWTKEVRSSSVHSTFLHLSSSLSSLL